jgi:folate-binding protein YgfZ
MKAMPDTHYVTIDVTGTDALTFLQGQLTADMRHIEANSPALAAWCNPKGRVICLFRVRRLDNGFALSVPADLAEAVVRRLTMFRFRAKVDFSIRDADTGEPDLPSGAEDWRLGNLRAGIPEICADQSEKFTPHMLNLDLLGAISLDKGCYTGQEVVARTHYRGATRRRTLRFESETPVAVGTKVTAAGRDIGEVLNAIGKDLLAVMPLDNKDSALSADGISLRHIPLPYFE